MRVRGWMLQVALLGVLLAAGAARGQTIALSFDDGFDPRRQPDAGVWNAAMLDALAYAEVRAILFPAGKHVDSPQGIALVRAWGDAGHAIGNHTYTHFDFASPTRTVDEFTADVERDDALLRAAPGYTRRLRFPFLKEGDTEQKRDGVRDWLASHAYRSGAVTIDTSDWYYDERFRAWQAKHPDGDPTPFRQAYLAHLASRIAYYDDLSQRVLHRSVKHVLLLHTNAINAAFLPDVIDMLRATGWTIVRPGEAYADPVYATQPNTLPAGESLLWAIAKDGGVADLRYPAEDGRYEKPLLDALGL